MTTTLPISLVVHGHFYQPPRENPWTDEIPREPSAAPFHDWDARIQRAIIDKNVRVAEGDHIGHDLARDSLRHTVSEGGVTVVQKARDTLLTRSRNF